MATAARKGGDSQLVYLLPEFGQHGVLQPEGSTLPAARWPFDSFVRNLPTETADFNLLERGGVARVRRRRPLPAFRFHQAAQRAAAEPSAGHAYKGTPADSIILEPLAPNNWMLPFTGLQVARGGGGGVHA